MIPPELDLAGPSGSTEEVPPSASEEVPPSASEVPPSASQRKLGSLGEKGSTSGEECQGRRVLEIPTVANAIETCAVCSICHSKLKMCERLKNRRGMVSRITFQCTNKNCKNEIFISNPKSPKTKTLNKTAVLAARSAGLGRRGSLEFYFF